MNKVVYLHRKLTDNSVFYVGMGNKNRPHSLNRTEFWHKTVEKYGLFVDVVKTGMSNEDALELEMELISYYGRRDLGTGNLVNLTVGGEGVKKGEYPYLLNIETGEFDEKDNFGLSNTAQVTSEYRKVSHDFKVDWDSYKSNAKSKDLDIEVIEKRYYNIADDTYNQDEADYQNYVLGKMISTLSKQHQQVANMRINGASFKCIGDQLGLTSERVKQIFESITLKFKRKDTYKFNKTLTFDA